ncbi:hypothetical protein U1Q18_036790 [Sarracenia purpurea var. burkii]
MLPKPNQIKNRSTTPAPKASRAEVSPSASVFHPANPSKHADASMVGFIVVNLATYLWPVKFRPRRSAPARRVSTLVVTCATAGPLDALRHCVSRPSPVAAVTFHHCYRFAPPRWPPQISCYHCAASASASDQPLRAAEVAPLPPLQPLRTAPLITRTAPPPALAAPAVAPPQSRSLHRSASVAVHLFCAVHRLYAPCAAPVLLADHHSAASSPAPDLAAASAASCRTCSSPLTGCSPSRSCADPQRSRCLQFPTLISFIIIIIIIIFPAGCSPNPISHISL